MKLTKAKLQQIISEEYQKIVNEEGGAEVDSRGDLVQYVRQELPPLIQGLSGIQAAEAGLIVDLFHFVLGLMDGKSVNEKTVETIKQRISNSTAYRPDQNQAMTPAGE